MLLLESGGGAGEPEGAVVPVVGGDSGSWVPSGKEEGLAASVSAEPAEMASSEASSLLSMSFFKCFS